MESAKFALQKSSYLYSVLVVEVFIPFGKDFALFVFLKFQPRALKTEKMPSLGHAFDKPIFSQDICNKKR
jgi:hypothetical protein